MKPRRPILILLSAALLLGTPALAAAQGGEAPGQETGQEPGRTPPRPAARLEISDLWEVLGGPGPDGERTLTDLFAGPDGLLLGFARGFLTLGPALEVDWRTVRDLESRESLARDLLERGFLATHAGLSPLGEVIQYDANTGALLYTHPLTGERRQYRTEVRHPLQCVILPAGGVALLQERAIALFRRDGEGLRRTEIPLPAGRYTCLGAAPAGPAGAADHLWAYDWQRRRVAVLNPAGDVVDSIALRTEGGAPLFPQVLEPCPDGGFLLGGSGELWRYSRQGALLWKTRTFTRMLPSGELREALPPVFDLAALPGRPGFYLLDLASSRVLLFHEEAAPSPPPAVPGTPTSGTTALKAGALRELSERLEEELLLKEAETACARSLELYRELQQADPVDPAWPQAIRSLTERRAGLRRILYEEPLLRAALPPVLKLYEEQTLALTAVAGRPLQDLEITARFAGAPALAELSVTHPTLEAGAVLRLPLTPKPEWGREELYWGVQEAVSCRLVLRVRCRIGGEPRTFHLNLPVTVVAGTP